jgi:DNA-binding response OmpR family regulator
MACVLVIDDEVLVRETLGNILRRAKYEVITAKNGAEGLAAFRQRPIDLVITDIIMPEKEGIETIIELRRLMPSLPIIAISGGGRTDQIDFLAISKKLGANQALAKPFMAEQLLAAVAACLPTP